MFDIFEQPWTLLTVAIIVLLVMLTVRKIFPEKRQWWQLALPALLAIAAFGSDWLVETDLEKVNTLINTGIKAVQEENPDTIDTIISANYGDSHHNTKEDLMAYCRMMLSEPLVEKNKKHALIIEISPPTATATLTVLTKFNKESFIYQNLRTLLTKIQLDLQKQPNKKWLINKAEILELNRQPTKWKHIR
ncbi:MAG: hypothetical protein ACYS83_08155 [Planctomycetota bacterium]|jgi:hypothetical protein